MADLSPESSSESASSSDSDDSMGDQRAKVKSDPERARKRFKISPLCYKALREAPFIARSVFFPRSVPLGQGPDPGFRQRG